jgi:hypothetical protein
MASRRVSQPPMPMFQKSRKGNQPDPKRCGSKAATRAR